MRGQPTAKAELKETISLRPADPDMARDV
jgi:hypothetical protein